MKLIPTAVVLSVTALSALYWSTATLANTNNRVETSAESSPAPAILSHNAAPQSPQSKPSLPSSPQSATTADNSALQISPKGGPLAVPSKMPIMAPTDQSSPDSDSYKNPYKTEIKLLQDKIDLLKLQNAYQKLETTSNGSGVGAEFNLIGIYGSPNNLDALVKAYNGDIINVHEGELIDGFLVRKINPDSMIVVRHGKQQNIPLIQLVHHSAAHLYANSALSSPHPSDSARSATTPTTPLK